MLQVVIFIVALAGLVAGTYVLGEHIRTKNSEGRSRSWWP